MKTAAVAAIKTKNAVAGASSKDWKPTLWVGIAQRGNKFRAYKSKEYLKTWSSLEEAKQAIVDAGGTVAMVRAKRESNADFISKTKMYLDWVVDSGYEPADLTASNEFREQEPHLVRAAPATYQLAIEGKEAPWSRLLVRAYNSLSHTERTKLLLLTSAVPTEFMEAARIQHKIECYALEGAAKAPFRKERKWWVMEVNLNVSQHMGWLSKALARKSLKKLDARGGGGSAWEKWAIGTASCPSRPPLPPSTGTWPC